MLKDLSCAVKNHKNEIAFIFSKFDEIITENM